MGCKKPILHLFDWDNKFVPSFINFIEQHFDPKEHRFIIYGPAVGCKLPVSENVIYCPRPLKSSWRIWAEMRASRKIVLHGLFNSHMLRILLLHSWVLTKSCWVIWGGDLYGYRHRDATWRARLNELTRRFVIKNMSLITTTVPGDYVLAKKWYKTRAEFVQNLMYPSHLARKSVVVSRVETSIVRVQIGNSADPENNHIEVIDMIAACNFSDNTLFYAPLSYGSRPHADHVAEYGKRILGDKFVPIREMMGFDEYTQYLSGIDIALFNHKRQQAMGNTIALLSLGKKVFLRQEVTPWAYLNGMGLKVFDIAAEFDLKKIEQDDARRNMTVCEEQFTTKNLIESWKRVFSHERF